MSVLGTKWRLKWAAARLLGCSQWHSPVPDATTPAVAAAAAACGCCLATLPHTTIAAPLAALALRQKLEAIGRAVRERAVDAVLFLDRLDSYKVDTLDRKVGTCSVLVVLWRCAGTALGGGLCSNGGIHGCSRGLCAAGGATHTP